MLYPSSVQVAFEHILNERLASTLLVLEYIIDFGLAPKTPRIHRLKHLSSAPERTMPKAAKARTNARKSIPEELWF